MQVPDASSLSANLSFENYLTDRTIQEAWNKAQKDVIVLHLVILPCAEPKPNSLHNRQLQMHLSIPRSFTHVLFSELLHAYVT